MPYEIISTGSKGNSIVFNTNILLDAGLPFKTLKNHLKNIDIIFISHTHSDHLQKKTISLIAYNFPTIKFICNLDVAKVLVKCGVDFKNIWCLEENKWYNIGFARVRLEKLKHDVHNSSFQIEYRNGYKMIYIVDTAEIPTYIQAKNYDLYLCEANYTNDEELNVKIQQDYDNGLEFSHYERVRETHLSQEQAISWLKDNMCDDSQFEFIHQHIERENVKNEKDENKNEL